MIVMYFSFIMYIHIVMNANHDRHVVKQLCVETTVKGDRHDLFINYFLYL